ncbi:response regulator [Pseudomonas sp. N3-W]|uniref:Response regulator n=1 Tax=Pseudomonas fungipugnans TaxID=3024217 RepID=A0ABT6QJJ2_9PSED|nr:MULTISPECIES: response regulator [unclassified Pseudomonas]MDI2591050.1 response regulator [Pseudomonas sp. 681]UWF47477.1 response regulator [Pseudomonas sp. N3-W]
MPNKALRILIADAQHFHRMKIERLFNQLDYFRVAPVQDLAELLVLVEYGCEPFDLVVINASLAAGVINLPGLFLDNPQVRHAFVYDGEQAGLLATTGCTAEKVQVTHEPLPDSLTIGQLMARVDPCAQEPFQYRQQLTG